ncbi:hypothetical protein GCM10009104_23780 [Marinobacterium maritimum]|uniref:Transcriptional regulator, AlpA family n=1 Tax=Marinobacterium maritimum TaxID=500162 RepID=A0ABN1I7N8_9GAMM
MIDGDEILTKADIAERYKMKKSAVDTLCSRSPTSLPPFFKMGTATNSPIRFRRSDCDAWDEKRVVEALKLRKPKTPASLTDLLGCGAVKQ